MDTDDHAEAKKFAIEKLKQLLHDVENGEPSFTLIRFALLKGEMPAIGIDTNAMNYNMSIATLLALEECVRELVGRATTSAAKKMAQEMVDEIKRNRKGGGGIE